MKYIVANWKQHKSPQEALAWLAGFSDADISISDDVSVVVAAPFTLLPVMKDYIDEHQLPITLASQTISPFEEGAYTGEVGAKQLAGLVDHVIIGHSERRMYFHEGNQRVSQKVKQAVAGGLHVFVCVADQVTEMGEVPEQKIEVQREWYETQIKAVFAGLTDSQKEMVTLVYEPISAISTFGGEPLTAEEAVEAIEDIKNLSGEDVLVMYGGSVNPDNISTYWPHTSIAGVMPGGASLDIEKFSSIISQTQGV